jgi:putative transposase
VRFKFIHEHREEFNLEIMVRVLEVSKGGFYEWHRRPESKRTQTRRHLKDKIKTIHENSRNTYGAARVHACLLEENESCCKPVVASIMREQGLKGKRKGRVKQKTTNSKHAHPIAQNKLERAFDSSKPDLKWASDITYLPTTEGWLYLAVTLDLFSRKRPKPVRCCLRGQEGCGLEHERIAREQAGAGCARDGTKLEKPGCWTFASQ